MSRVSGTVKIASIALFLLAPLDWAKAAESQVFIFWDTVSPDGKYALGWSTSGSLDADDLAGDTNSDDSELKNGLVDVAARKMLLVLSGVHYWVLPPDGTHPNHYSMSTVWSDDSASLLAIYDWRYGTDQVYLVDVKTMRVKKVTMISRTPFTKLCGIKRLRITANIKRNTRSNFPIPGLSGEIGLR